ncbi:MULTISPECIES: hypothetical protein [Sphingomonas]|uniref:hypothetical protein n=1 Tax=Sphingomonas TaxID=13687 RepID=UPI000DEFFEED|nr:MULTISPECIES: hypothetical protein [Sphingomonas]
MRWRVRPVHGWPEFLTELAIVVFGVLIALGAQQLVDDWHGRRDVADLRTAVDAEVAENLAGYRRRIGESPCLNRKLDQLDRWQQAWRGGAGPAASGTIGRPRPPNNRTSVWRTGATGIAGQMPLDQRLTYGDIYDALDAYDSLRTRENAVWFQFFAFDGAQRLSPPEVNQLRGLILSARSIDQALQSNYEQIVGEAAGIGIRPRPVDPVIEARVLALTGLCEPLATG